MNALKHISSASDIPDFIKISGASPCEKHSFRTFYDGTVSWAEYAKPYKCKNRIVYLWQPMPTYLNVFFQKFISDQTYGTPFLNLKNTAHLFELMKAVYPTLKKAGLARRRPYETRHTAAVLHIAAHENPLYISHMLGHSVTRLLFEVYAPYVANASRQDGFAFNEMMIERGIA
ncbi:hypothetical protein [Pseudoalteromonas sp. C12FD-1]|uniref:hypothetical protein n=1 Tax=Pseudoalteromonas sp. C12FD-1 TaxID=3131979 RepID=UPI00307D2298